MTNKPMLSVGRDLIERAVQAIINTSQMQPALNELRALLDKEVDFLTPDCPDCACVQDGHCLCIPSKPAAQHQREPIKLSDDVREFLQEWIDSSTGGEDEDIDYDFASQLGVLLGPLYAEQPAPVAAQPQCEECKGWGYHENHHEGGGTECGECGGSGNAPVAVVMPDRMKVEPFTTIDRGSKNYKAGYNAALAEVARLNGVKP